MSSIRRHTTWSPAGNSGASAPVGPAARAVRRRWLLGFAVLTSLVFIGTACGSSTTEDAQSTTPATSAAAPSDGPTTAAPTAGTPAPASLTADLASVPLPAIVAASAAGEVTNPTQPVSGGTLRTKDGKPEVLYIGAEFCPYCAGERWSLTVALSQFGTFSGLTTIESSEGDIPTLSYVRSEYTSDFVAFTPIEMQDQNRRSLETPTDAQLEVFQRLGDGAFPFIDFGGKAFQNGGSVEITTLLGKNQVDIAAALAASTPDDTDQTKLEGTINAVAGGYIREICALTDDQPADVCGAISAG